MMHPVSAALRLALLTMIAAPSGGWAQAGEGRIAVLSQDGGSVALIDPHSLNLVKTVQIGKGPSGLAASLDGRQIYAAFPDANAIAVVDAQSGAVQRSFPSEGAPFGIAAGSGVVYVSDWTKNIVSRVDLVSGQTNGTVSVGRSPAGLAIDNVREWLFVANRESGDVSVVDVRTMRVIASIASGAAPFALALSPDRRLLYVANVRGDDLAVIDTFALKRLATTASGPMPYGVAVTPDGAAVLVTNQHKSALTIIDARSLETVASIPVGRYPEGVLAGPKGLAYVANWFSGDVSVVDIAERREIRRIKVGDGPRAIALLPDPPQSP